LKQKKKKNIGQKDKVQDCVLQSHEEEEEEHNLWCFMGVDVPSKLFWHLFLS